MTSCKALQIFYNTSYCFKEHLLDTFLYRKNLFIKENLNKKEHKQYTLFTIYTSNIIRKIDQSKHNSLFTNLLFLLYHLF